MGQFVKVFVVKAAPTAWFVGGCWVVAGAWTVVAGARTVVAGSGVAAVATGCAADVEDGGAVELVEEVLEAAVVVDCDSEVVGTAGSPSTETTNGEAGAAREVVLPSEVRVVFVVPSSLGVPT